jgi:tRNA 2-thiouridine synthesizing protein A
LTPWISRRFPRKEDDMNPTEAGGADGSRRRLDASGLLCPLPVLRTNKALRALQPGDSLEVLVTDPAAPGDLRRFCETAGHAFIDCREEGRATLVVIRKQG